MALRVAVTNGNWSSTSTWNGGVLPTTGDVVASNNFTVTIDQNINVDSLTNTAQSIVSLVPNMTSDTAPSGIASASSFYSGYNPYSVFDSNINTEWRYDGAQWIAYEFTSPKAVNQYTFTGYTNQTGWTFEGWNGSSWVVLHTITSVSVTTYTSPLIGNSTTYIKYRLNFSTTSLLQRVHTIAFYEYLGTTAAVAGGSFIISDGVSLTCNTVGINVNGKTLITYNGTTSCNINILALDISTSYTGNGGNIIVHTSSGTMNFIGSIRLGAWQSANVFYLSGAGVLNITGNTTCAPGSTEVRTALLQTDNVNSIVNITGSISGVTNASANYGGHIKTINGTLNITGAILGGFVPVISSGNSGKLTIIGAIDVSNTEGNTFPSVPVVRGSSTAINLFSGPFICHTYGGFPYQCVRMHLIPSVGNYFEFRDETTNGALFPGAIAPATRMLAPGGVSDSPSPANVRFGTVYANGSLTGTCKIPNVNSVAYGVQVDNTYGAAVLTPQSVWDYAIANLNTSGSIGERLKKAATVDSTGAQLSSFEF